MEYRLHYVYFNDVIVFLINARYLIPVIVIVIIVIYTGIWNMAYGI